MGPLGYGLSRLQDSGQLPQDRGTVKAFGTDEGKDRMADHSLPGAPAVPLTLRRNARARRITLRVSQLDGRVTLTLPRGVPEAEALEFARSREDWIRGHLDTRPVEIAVDHGSEIPVEGAPRRLVSIAGRRVVAGPQQIGVPQSGAAGARVQAWLKALARERLARACDRHAAALGRPYRSLTLRDPRSRWGSCTAAGGLMFSWRLVMAPPSVLDYVAAHEVAHLREMNHSPAFWRLVEDLYGPWHDARRWLHAEGAGLHRYRFDLAA